MRNTNVPAGATAGIQGLNENGYVGGNRIWKKITRSGSVVEHRVHIHAGPNLIAEYNAGVAASTPVQEYVYAGEIDSLVMIRRSDATRYGVTRNRQWSITALHDLANGNIVERYAYELTGKRTIYAANGTTVRTTSTYGNPFGYTNRWHDEDSGLMYFRARHYNPLTGEFLSRDPMEFVDGMSLYRGYMGFLSVDPTGRLTRAPRSSKDEPYWYSPNDSIHTSPIYRRPDGSCYITRMIPGGVVHVDVQCPSSFPIPIIPKIPFPWQKPAYVFTETKELECKETIDNIACCDKPEDRCRFYFAAAISPKFAHFQIYHKNGGECFSDIERTTQGYITVTFQDGLECELSQGSFDAYNSDAPPKIDPECMKRIKWGFDGNGSPPPTSEVHRGVQGQVFTFVGDIFMVDFSFTIKVACTCARGPDGGDYVDWGPIKGTTAF